VLDEDIVGQLEDVVAELLMQRPVVDVPELQANLILLLVGGDGLILEEEVLEEVGKSEDVLRQQHEADVQEEDEDERDLVCEGHDLVEYVVGFVDLEDGNVDLQEA